MRETRRFVQRYTYREVSMKSKLYAYALFSLHCLAYAIFLYIDYNFYEGGREFVLLDSLAWLVTLIFPVAISLIPWSVMLLCKRDQSAEGFYWSVAVFSMLGVIINSLAAYLAWWSTTQ